MPGFYDTGSNNPIAQPCASSCLDCFSTATTCTSCANDTLYLSSGTCLECSSAIIGCLTCSDSTTCTSCNSSDNRQLNPNTSQCDPIPGFYNDPQNDPVAQLCSSPCATCQSGPSTCVTCVNNTYGVDLSNSSCLPCSMITPNCALCTTSQMCTQCNTGPYYLAPLILGCASLSCQVCSTCLYECATCTNGINCATCNAIDNRQMNISTSMCDPVSGYYDDGSSTIAQPCSSPCVTCQSGPLLCLTCVNDTYAVNPSNSNCMLCSALMSNCIFCTSYQFCTQCAPGPYYLAPLTSGCT